MPDTDFGAAARQLREDGYCVVPELLDDALLAQLQADSATILGDLPEEHRARNRSQGSLVQLSDHPQYAGLISYPPLWDAFGQLGFADPRFSSGYLISKPPRGPALFWHQDWWGWDEVRSYTDVIDQVFGMFYLTDTRPENGCLRVIPGSHRRRHPLHAATAAHDEALSRVDEPDHPLYQSQPEEMAVPVKAGDLVIGDARLLHSAYSNQSDQERSLLTLWFHPNYPGLPAPLRARIRAIFERRGVDTDPGGAGAMTPESWPGPWRDMLDGLLPEPTGDTTPHPWNRVPNWEMAG